MPNCLMLTPQLKSSIIAVLDDIQIKVYFVILQFFDSTMKYRYKIFPAKQSLRRSISVPAVIRLICSTFYLLPVYAIVRINSFFSLDVSSSMQYTCSVITPSNHPQQIP
jgi:hypothetical protein